MAKKKLNNIKYPNIQIDKSLDKYVDMPLFQDKVDKANKMLSTIGLPKGLYKS